MRRFPVVLAAAVAVACRLLACGQADGGAKDEGGQGGDAPVSAVCKAAAPDPSFAYPAGPYGTAAGDRIEAFTLADCDGNPVRFADVLGSGDLALVAVAAGWCAPCAEEAKGMQAGIYEKYCDRGLRVVQVLFEDAAGAPADGAFCRKWRDRYGLSFPVLVDPDFVFERYMGGSLSASTPLNLLVDRAAVIRYRAAGPVPSDFDARIEELLP
ncbi:MAG: TlpA family protein disulfide reductase [Deltaproteobacteria bacterium]|nr:TlpA family protein disulfide reductase [Deltaproteobacteria bacterium]